MAESRWVWMLAVEEEFKLGRHDKEREMPVQ